jgi:tetratricopeptide (TPR) repeat protein
MKRALPIALWLLAACAGLPEGRFAGTGPHARKITTASSEAQAWFDQGLAFLHAFNHDEAIRSFERAAQADPACAMAPWGVALANGPHINNPAVDEAHAKAASKALARAKELSAGASPVERDLIDALAKRHADPQPADRGPLDQAFADAMRALWRKHPKDADLGAWTAEALMDLHPWDLWQPDGKPQPWTGEIVQALESVLALEPAHPLGLHLYIHAVEASPEPGKADAAADRLRDLCPGLGHLVHMPSHIDVRRGRWGEAVASNDRAIAADAAYLRRAHPPGFYRLYMAHNRHMLAFASMMRGDSRRATESLRAMFAEIPDGWLKENAALVDGFLASPYEVHLRFGRWEAMLAEPEPAESFPLARALRLFARGVAQAALGRADAARVEQKAFLEAKKRVPKDAAFGNNAATDLLGVAEPMLDGEILYREGKAEEAFLALTEAVRREDALRYDEPPDWIQPVRHSLGAALMKSGRAAAAERVYREDLARWPGNGWSLYGLARSLREQGKPAEAADAERAFRAAWSTADVAITSSCLCLPGEKR